MDPRATRAQELFFEIQANRRTGSVDQLGRQLVEMAKLHEELSLDLFADGNPDAFVDLYAAITAWGEAGEKSKAQRLIDLGRQWALTLKDGRTTIEEQLAEMQAWMDAAQFSSNVQMAQESALGDLPVSSTVGDIGFTLIPRNQVTTVETDRSQLARHLVSCRRSRDEKLVDVETRFQVALKREHGNLHDSRITKDFSQLVSRGLKQLESSEPGSLSFSTNELALIAEAYGMSSLLLQSLRSRSSSGNHLTQSFDDFSSADATFGKGATYRIPQSKLAGTEDVQVLLAEIEPGGCSDAHMHPGDELTFVLNGEIEIRLQDSGIWTRLGKGSYIHFYSDQYHSVHNLSADAARLIIVRFFPAESEGIQHRLRQINAQNPTKGLIRQVLQERAQELRANTHISREPAGQVLDRVGLGRFLEACKGSFRGIRAPLRTKDLVEKGKTVGLRESKITKLQRGEANLSVNELKDIARMYEVAPLLLYDFLFPALRNAVVVRTDTEMSRVPDEFLSDSNVKYNVPIRRLAESNVAVSTLDLPANSASPEAIHPGFTLLIPLEGRIVLHVAGQETELIAGRHAFSHFWGATSHRFSNVTAQPAKTLVVRFFVL